MEPTTHIDLTKLLRVLRALHDGIQRNLEYGMHAGTGDTAYKSYVALHARAAAALPDDAYVTEALRVEMAEDVDDGTRLAAVNLALRQLVAYLETEVRGGTLPPPHPPEPSFPPRPPVPPRPPTLEDIGRSVSESVLNITRAALRRAVVSSDDHANLSGANLAGVSMRGGDFSDGNLSGANCANADFTQSDFSDANLSGANMSRATLEYANLSDANLSGANFQGANLHGVGLDDANISGANFQEAVLEQASMTGVNAKGANFTGAILTATVLDDANLRGANLTGAQMQQATLEGAEFSRDTVLPDGTLWSPGVNMSKFTGE